MTHTINKTNHRTTTPTGLYEANYRRLLRLAPQISELHVKDDLLLSASRIALRILEQYKYTTVISLKQSLQTQLSTHLKTMTHLSVIDMELRICHDACL
ncbi:MAG: DUF1249 domain-containing protein, partial [gamma proteobacterium symbiont of Lucinoma myriamae]|nr:DUF1249 domain-containing protein [gamma proteobacterium symbiont of Lucinoma myriamae]